MNNTLWIADIWQHNPAAVIFAALLCIADGIMCFLIIHTIEQVNPPKKKKKPVGHPPQGGSGVPDKKQTIYIKL